MKIEFTRECMDKTTHERYHIGEVREFSSERALEICGVGFALIVEDEPAKEVAQEATNEEPLKLSEMKKAELVELAKEHGVSTKGTKEEIIQRVLQL